MTADAFADLVPRNELAAPFWAAVDEGHLAVQRCTCCGHHWLPARAECPSCLSPTGSWVRATGSAKLVSWVVYHTALHPAFEAQLPYNVAVVELEEGARMVSNIVDADLRALRIDQPLRLVLRERGGIRIPQFAPVN
jgi:uncharacterized protein